MLGTQWITALTYSWQSSMILVPEIANCSIPLFLNSSVHRGSLSEGHSARCFYPFMHLHTCLLCYFNMVLPIISYIASHLWGLLPFVRLVTCVPKHSDSTTHKQNILLLYPPFWVIMFLCLAITLINTVIGMVSVWFWVRFVNTQP